VGSAGRARGPTGRREQGEETWGGRSWSNASVCLWGGYGKRGKNITEITSSHLEKGRRLTEGRVLQDSRNQNPDLYTAGGGMMEAESERVGKMVGGDVAGGSRGLVSRRREGGLIHAMGNFFHCE